MKEFVILLLSVSLSGGIVAGLAFALKALFKGKLSKTALFYLWIPVLLRLVMPFSTDGSLMNRAYGYIMAQQPSATSAYEARNSLVVLDSMREHALSVTVGEGVEAPYEQPQAEQPLSERQGVQTETARQGGADTSATVGADTAQSAAAVGERVIFETAFWVWAAGAAAYLIYSGVSYARFTHVINKYNRPLKNETVDRLCGGIPVFTNSLAKVPMLTGVFRPRIIVTDAQYSDSELEFILRHELVHAKRLDLVYKWFAVFVTAAHWFNPISYIVRRELNSACELACDEAVIRELDPEHKRGYGETLINLSADVSGRVCPAAAAHTTLCEGGRGAKKQLTERLSVIKRFRKRGLGAKFAAIGMALILLTVSMLTGACGTDGTTVSTGIFDKVKTDYPDRLSIVAPTFFAGATSLNDAARESWLNAVYRQYGVSLNVIANSYGETPSYAADLTARSFVLGEGEHAEYAGFVALDYSDVYKCVGTERIVPLDEYLANNKTWNELPKEIRSMFETDGHIWAIPCALQQPHELSVGVRTVDSDYPQWQGAVPTDFDDFAQMLQSPDWVGDVTLIGGYGTTGRGGYGGMRSNPDVYWLSDLFRSYGMYTDGLSPFAYDPIDDCINDCLLKPQALEMLGILRWLYTNGAISEDLLTVTRNAYQQAAENGEYLTYYSAASPSQVYDTQGDTLLFTLNPQYPQVVTTHKSGYVLTASSGERQQSVDFLVELLFGSEESYLTACVGLPQSYVRNSDGTFTLKDVSAVSEYELSLCTPNLVVGLAEAVNIEQPVVVSSAYTEQMRRTLLEERSSYAKLIERKFADSTLKDVDVSLTQIVSAEYENSGGRYRMYFLTCIYDAMCSQTPLPKLLSRYRFQMDGYLAQVALDEANETIGRTAAYRYYE